MRILTALRAHSHILIWIREMAAVVPRSLQVRDEDGVGGHAVSADDQVVRNHPCNAAGDRDLAEGLLDARGEVLHLADARLRQLLILYLCPKHLLQSVKELMIKRKYVFEAT